MFTGLVEEAGVAASLHRDAGGGCLMVRASFAPECREGESIAVNGCCLTAVSPPSEHYLQFDLLDETLRRTTLGQLPENGLVNLERALPANGRFGGHFVQGHIDCTAHVLALEPDGTDYRLEIELPQEFARYVIEKGSIAIDGISLTVAELREKSFTSWIIPHTYSTTNLRQVSAGALVNLEFDLIAKYVERLTAAGRGPATA